MKATKIEVWKNRAGGLSWHAKASNGRIITPSESYSRWRAARANIEGTYPMIMPGPPVSWKRGARRLVGVSLRRGRAGFWQWRWH